MLISYPNGLLDNYMKMNDDKSHFLMFGGKEDVTINIGSANINESQNEKSFIISQFSYYQLIGMCHDRKLNNRINQLHERSLRLLLNDN